MKAAIVRTRGAPPVYGDFDHPRADEGEARVTVTMSAVSQLTRGRASGAHYSSGDQYPFIPGVDGVGRLDDGRRVYFLLPRGPFGAMADETVVPIANCLPLPDGLDDVTAAVVANPGMSSWAALTERARIQPGETVLINGATGASGQLAVKIARHLGAGKVIVTGRNAAVLAGLDADSTIKLDGDDHQLEEAFRPSFANTVDIVLDYLWGPSARALLIAAAKESAEGRPIRFVQIGAVSGVEIALPAPVLRSSAIELKGSGLGSVGFDRLKAAIGGVLGVAEKLALSIDHRCVPLSRIEATWGEPDQGRRLVYAIDGQS